MRFIFGFLAIALAAVTITAMVSKYPHSDSMPPAGVAIAAPATVAAPPLKLHADQSHAPMPTTHVHIVRITYTVQPGDNLTSIAQEFSLSGWQPLYAQNRAVVGTNPSLIHPGEILFIASAETA